MSKHTARSHMKVIFEKTGTHSQAELLKKVFRHPTVFIGQKDSATATLEHLKALDIKPHQHSAPEMFKMIHLHDGRNMEYREYGSPTGTPIIFLHSMIHSRKSSYPLKCSLEDRNIRLIAPERPGYGASDMMLAYSVSDYAKDITQLADNLGIECFYIVGDMDSSAYALACACHMPKRILKAVSIACCLPYSEDDSLDTLISFERTIMFMMRKAPVIMPYLGKIVIKALKRNPDMYFERVGKELCEPDKQVFATEEHRKIFHETFENMRPENADGFLESYFTPLHTWDFDPGDIQVPVQLWHGVQDQRSSVQFAQKLAATIPVSDLHFIEHGGHFIFHTHWEHMLDTLLGEC